MGFTPQNVTTEDDFIEFVKYLMPGLNDNQIQQVLAEYALPASLPTVGFATDGLNENATAVFVSPFAVGQQQRANVLPTFLVLMLEFTDLSIEPLFRNNFRLFCLLDRRCIRFEE
jgi:hypothetical protein